MHKGKIFQTDRFIIQPFTVDLENRASQLIRDLIYIFSKQDVIKFNLNRRLTSEHEASNFIMSTLNGYENQTHYDYFLFRKDNGVMVGTVHLLAPKRVASAYPFIGILSDIKDCSSKNWMIEYYLDSPYWRKGIMKLFVNWLVNELFKQGAEVVSALVTESNVSSVALLESIGFRKDSQYRDTSGQVLWWKKQENNII